MVFHNTITKNKPNKNKPTNVRTLAISADGRFLAVGFVINLDNNRIYQPTSKKYSKFKIQNSKFYILHSDNMFLDMDRVDIITNFSP